MKYLVAPFNVESSGLTGMALVRTISLFCFLSHLSPCRGTHPVPAGLLNHSRANSLTVAWITDLHLQHEYSSNARAEDHCIKRENPSTGSSNFFVNMETDAELGRIGCSSSPRLIDASLTFLQGLVAQSSSSGARGDGHLYFDKGYDPAASAFKDYPVSAIRTVLLTGDYIYHPKGAEEELMKSSLAEVTHMVFDKLLKISSGKQESPTLRKPPDNLQLLLVPGNHDIPKSFIFPSFRREWSEFLYTLWQPALPNDEMTRKSFLRGLYYSTSLRGAPSVRVLCLNTNLYSKKLRKAAKETQKTSRSFTIGMSLEDELSDEKDPARQFAWMEEELRSARALGQQVLIAGHIAPGIATRLGSVAIARSSWEDSYASMYRDLVAEYSDIVIAQLYGHDHDGRVSTLLPRGIKAEEAAAKSGPGCLPLNSGLPTAILNCPAITPQDGNNPAMRVLVFEPRTDLNESLEDDEMLKDHRTPAYTLADYAQYHLPLFGYIETSQFGRTAPVFKFDHSFQDTFRPFMRCSKAQQSRVREEDQVDSSLLSARRARCIDGSAALQLADALRRSAHAFSTYQNCRYAGGHEIPSAALSCVSMALTEEEVSSCLAEGMQQAA